MKSAKKPRQSETLHYITNIKKLLTEYSEVDDFQEIEMEQLHRTMKRMQSDSSISENYKYESVVTIKKFFRKMQEFVWERPNRVRRILNSDLTKLEAPPESQRNRTPFSAEEVVAMHQTASDLADAVSDALNLDIGPVAL